MAVTMRSRDAIWRVLSFPSRYRTSAALAVASASGVSPYGRPARAPLADSV